MSEPIFALKQPAPEPVAVRIIAAFDLEHKIRRLLGDHRDFRLQDEEVMQDMPRIHAAGTHEVLFVEASSPDYRELKLLALAEPSPHRSLVIVARDDKPAKRAFDLNALDFLVMPVEAHRFNQTLERIRAQCTRASHDPSYPVAVQPPGGMSRSESPAAAPGRMVLRDAGRVYYFGPQDIEWLESSGNYVHFHAGERSPLIRASLKNLETRLPSQFLRIRSNVMINVNQIVEIRIYKDRQYQFTLCSGKQLTSSRRYYPKLNAFVETELKGGT